MSSQCSWILKFIYQNYNTSTLYHYIWLPSSGISTWHSHKTWLPSLGIEPCSFSTSSTILLIGRQKSLMLSFDVSITFSWTLRTMPCESGSTRAIRAIGHLFLPMSSFRNTASPTWKFFLLIFHFCCAWRLWRNSFRQRDQNSPAICCTHLHRLREYRSGLLNTPRGGIITSFFMVRRLLGDNGISLLMSLRDSTVRGLELMTASVSATSVLNPLSLRLWPWVFSKAARIPLALPILCSQTPPICEAQGGFLCHVIQSVPFHRR